MRASTQGLIAEVEPHGPHVRLALAGTLERRNAWILRESLRALPRPTRTIHLDLSQISAIDRGGADVLVEGIQDAGRSGASVVVEPVSAAVVAAVPMIRLWCGCP